MSLTNYTFTQICQMLVVPAFFATLKMLLISGVLSTIFGFVFGVILILTEKGGLCQNVVINRILDFLVNTIRSFPFIISGLCLAIINLLGCTAMAGAVGAGGLGAVALTYGYQNFNKQIMYTICVVLIILVAIIQYFGDWIYKKLK